MTMSTCYKQVLSRIRLADREAMVAGFLASLYTLSGRWSVARFEYGQDAFDPPAYQIRHYILFAFVIVTFHRFVRRTRCQSRGSTPPRYLTGFCTIFFLYVTSTALWAPIGAPSLIKAIDISSLALATICVCSWTGSTANWTFQTTFWRTFCTIVGAFMALTLAGYGFNDVNRTAVFGGGPNAFGRNVGLAFFGSIWLRRERSDIRWILVAVLAPLLVIMSGSRGALVAFSSGLVTYVLTEKLALWKRLTGVAGLAFVCAMLLLYSSAGEKAISTFQLRVVELTLNQHHSAGRSAMARSAFEMGLANPLLGAGLSAFPVATGEPYAHNIFLEVFSETGSLGVTLLVLPFLVFAHYFFKLRKQTSRASLCALTTAFVSAQFSGGLFDSRCIFEFLVITVSVVVPICSSGRLMQPAHIISRYRAVPHRVPESSTAVLLPSNAAIPRR